MASTTVPLRVDNSGNKSRGLFRWVKGAEASKALKLRHRFPVDIKGRTTLELGVDYPLERNGFEQGTPYAALLYQLDPAGTQEQGAIELTPEWVTYNRNITIPTPIDNFDIPITAKVGMTHAGKPHVDLTIHRLAVVIPAALALLALGKPVSVTRSEIGGVGLSVPIANSQGVTYEHTLYPKAEVTAKLQRKGRGLELDVSALNALLRLARNPAKL